MQGLPRFGLSWLQFNEAEQVYHAFGKKLFCAKDVGAILGINSRVTGFRTRVWRENKAILVDHVVFPDPNSPGKRLRYYRFTDQWDHWYRHIYQKNNGEVQNAGVQTE